MNLDEGRIRNAAIMELHREIVFLRVTSKPWELCQAHAIKAALGGRSKVRASKERARELLDDQVSGQLGELALHVWLYGRQEGLERYDARRRRINRTPFVGAPGSDVDEFDVDVWASKMRGAVMYEHHLFVTRPNAGEELSLHHVLGLANFSDRCVYLLGGVFRGDLPLRHDPSAPRHKRSTFAIPAYRLRSMGEIREAVLETYLEGAIP